MPELKDIIIKNRSTLRATDTLEEAQKIMWDEKAHHLLVTDDKKKLIGVVSDRDIMKFSSPFAGSSLLMRED